MFQRNDPGVSITLPSDREIALTRTFAWSSSRLFEAWTEPRHLRAWWGCDGSHLTTCEVDLRPGKGWHFVLRMVDASEHSFKGVYRKILPAQRLV